MPNPIDHDKFPSAYHGLLAACCVVFPVQPGRPTVRRGRTDVRSAEADSLCGWLVDQMFLPVAELGADHFADLLDELSEANLEATLARWRKEAAWSCDCGEVVPPDVADCPSCQPSLWCRCGQAKPREDALMCDACAADAADMRGER